MNLGWTLRRLSAMSAAEIAHRCGRAVGISAERALLMVGLGTQPEPILLDEQRPAMVRPWFSLQPGAVPVDRYRLAADQVLDGSISFFALESLQVGFPPRWNVEPKSGIDIPLTFGKKLNYRDISRVGDVKNVWEINRHPQLVTLAQAWHLSGDRRYLEGCRALLESWIDQCPYPYGINWTCSLEPAMRLINWSAAWFLIGGENSPLFEGDSGKAFRQRWMKSIWQHCQFIRGYLSRHSSANNHLLGELLGLYVGTSVWPLGRDARAWNEFARSEFQKEALKQNTPDGVNREQAIYYHHFVLEMMIFAGLVSRTQQQPFSPEYWQRIESMLELLASVIDSGGNAPAIGDEDGAVVVDFTAHGIEDVYASLLAKGAVLFSRGDFRHKAREFSEQCRWLLGDESAQRFAALQPETRTLPPRRAFEQGGWYVLGDAFETPAEVRMVVDVAPLGYLGIAAHGHADALAFTLSVGGEPVLIDTGTYGYYIEKHWRDYFRSTAAHNTVRVDGEDQSVSGGPFLWTRHAQARKEQYSSDATQDRLVGSHDGYTRYADPVTHRRRIDYDKARRCISVEDSMECKGSHLVEQFWHFHPDVALTLRGHTLVARTKRCTVTFELPADSEVTLATGQESPLLGWSSARFGELQRCHTLVASRRIAGPWQATTRIQVA
jgi:hypothetical protein